MVASIEASGGGGGKTGLALSIMAAIGGRNQRN